MRLINNPLFSILNDHLVDYPIPINLNFFYKSVIILINNFYYSINRVFENIYLSVPTLKAQCYHICAKMGAHAMI
jgi:hypothetical protein